MAWNPTPEQRIAVDTLDRTLLVSAAAGAGKTSTLIQRILHSLETGEGDLSRMLIVTFTRAAASELRERIEKELSLAVASGGERAKRLAKQLLLLPNVKISTIDSFCLGLIREHVGKFGISPSFRLADEAENKLLLASVMTRLLDDCCAGHVESVSQADFEEFVGCFASEKGVPQTDGVLLSLYDKVRYYGKSYHLLEKMGEDFLSAIGTAPFDTPWGKYIKTYTASKLLPYYSTVCEIRDLVSTDTELCEQGYDESVNGNYAVLHAIHTSLERNDYAGVRAALAGWEKQKTPSKKITGNVSLAKKVKKVHGELQNKTGLFRTLFNNFYAFPAEEWENLLRSLAKHAHTAARLLAVFSARVDEEKRRRGVLSFSDLSHYAYELLCDGEGKKTPLAEEMSKAFDFIYVDEYQDVNEVQDAIFAALAGPHARFMVGDVKQSIYGFRGAQPDIFAKLRERFPDYANRGDSPEATISLAANFRSDPAILNFVNLVFNRHMQGGLAHKIGYVEEQDRLNPQRAPTGDRVTVALFENEAYKSGDGDGEEDFDTPTEDGDAPESLPANMAEANYVADEICRIYAKEKENNSEFQYKSFAILTSTEKAATSFAEALAARGIKCSLSGNQTFFQKPEILLLLSLLNTIDNPHKDVYLAGVLLSPLYRVSPDTLVAVRRAVDDGARKKGKSKAESEREGFVPLYDALLAYHEKNETPQITHFLEDLALYRRMAEGCPVHELIWQLYRKTGLLALASENGDGAGAERRANLLLFYDYARRFEASSYHGLYNFITYINRAVLQGASLEESSDTKVVDDDRVQIMTIHKSKGLEFPYCFVCDCGHKFNTSDASARALFNRDYGFAVKMRDKTGYGIMKNPIYNVLSSMTVESANEEYLRLLYVALTRAARRLYVTATVRDVSALMQQAQSMDTPLTLAQTYDCRTHAQMIISAVGADNSYDLLINGEPFLSSAREAAPEAEAEETVQTQEAATEKQKDADNVQAPAQTEGTDADGPTTQEYEETLKARFSFVYPDEHLCRIAGKYAVSQLHPRALEEESEIVQERFSDEPNKERETQTKPRFLDEKQNNAAERGTATHLFMQFCDFAATARIGVKEELARLKREKFITEKDADLVRVKEVEAFFGTPLCAAFVASGARLWREQRFHARFAASAFVEDPTLKARYENETVLVQGVMDAVLETEEGQLWLIDYKTDRVERESVLRERYTNQLAYYTAACREMFGRLPDRVIIYSLALGREIDLPVTLPEGI